MTREWGAAQNDNGSAVSLRMILFSGFLYPIPLGYNAPMSSPDMAQPSQARFQLSRIGILILGLSVILVWLMGTPSGLLGKADAIGYAVCHRIDLRSFHLGERTLPLCSRCSGMYLGVLLAFTYFAILRKKAALFPPKHLVLQYSVPQHLPFYPSIRPLYICPLVGCL